MSTEVQTVDVEDELPPVVETKPVKNGKKPRSDDKDKDDESSDEPKAAKASTAMSPVLREIQQTEEKALRDWILGFGLAENAFKVVVSRRYPKMAFDKTTGREIKVNGHLETVYEFIDDEHLKSRHGGGTFTVQVHSKDAGGRWKYLKQRDIEIAGDPRTDNLPHTMADEKAAPAPSSAPPAESPTIIQRAFDTLEKQIDRAHQASAPPPPPQDLTAILDLMKATLAQRDAEIGELRRSLTELQQREPPKDEIKDKLLGSLIDGESGRITAIRTQHESEIRMMKESAVENERRLRDGFERDRTAIVQSHERELQSLKTSNEVTLSAIKTSFETQTKILEGQVKQLERQVDRLEAENKELRAKKEKGVIEMVKDMREIKEAFSDEEDEKEETTFDKIAGMIANPDTLRFAQGLITKTPPGAAPGVPVATPPRPVPRYKKQIVQMPDGTKMQLNEDGSLQGPVKKKPVVPGQVDIPEVPPEQVAMAVSFLEQAFGKQTPPDEVATSVRMMIPAETSHAIAAVGIDTFMNKVAKLPPTSPLATQKGRVWVREVAKLLT